mmetsp:Transcript_14873/g.41658  ORF Transcript_14873/g.41658 Transcript_14873/m.41658 type:complete len:99 (+) Transcript_14873:1599-1895(+)
MPGVFIFSAWTHLFIRRSAVYRARSELLGARGGCLVHATGRVRQFLRSKHESGALAVERVEPTVPFGVETRAIVPLATSTPHGTLQFGDTVAWPSAMA